MNPERHATTRSSALLNRLPTFVALAVLQILPTSAQTWDTLLPTIRRQFSSVRQLSTGDLSLWLADTNRPTPVLIDTRAPAEFEVSHLPSAKNATSLAELRNLKIPKDQPIVLYCSVGWRSSALGEKLIKDGYTRVQNLEGSIFAWANEGRPVYQGTQQVAQVHPFDAKWGQLLQPRYRAPIP